MKELPHEEIRMHSQEMYRTFMHDKLRTNLKNKMEPIMQRILTEYISGLLKYNTDGLTFVEPLNVTFGDALKYSVKCASKA